MMMVMKDLLRYRVGAPCLINTKSWQEKDRILRRWHEVLDDVASTLFSTYPHQRNNLLSYGGA